MSQPATLKVEEAAGRRADFLVHYLRGGKRYVDGLWATSVEEARATFDALAQELGWKATVEKIEPREETKP